MKRVFSTALVLLAMAVSSSAFAMRVTSITAEPNGSGTVRIIWSASEGAAYYELYRDSVRIESNITATAVDVSGLADDTDYQFFVTACQTDRSCSEASNQADVRTSAAGSSGGDGEQCPAATDGSSPVVSLSDNGDSTATLSWCQVEGAKGYNLFVNNDYVQSFGAETLSTSVAADNSVYQISWYANGNYPPKSAPVQLDSGTSSKPPMNPPGMTFANGLAQLESENPVADNAVEIYFTRHAEKETQVAEGPDGVFTEVCGEDKCAEVLNAKGELRAELLVGLFADAGITSRLTNAYSSHKIRTRQTIEMIVADAGLSGDDDKFANDGIQEFPVMNKDGSANATELDPEGTSASEQPVIDALTSLPAGSVALVAGHSGTLYDIMAGLGLTDVCLKDTVDSCNQDRYPVNDDVKVKNFGDIWKIALVDGTAEFIYRGNFQPSVLQLEESAQ